LKDKKIIRFDDMVGNVWREFVELVGAGKLPPERIQPYIESLRPALQGFVQNLQDEKRKADLERVPEIHPAGSQIHYLLPLDSEQYCFSFLVDGEKWWFQHVECITLRLDHLGELPCSVFPDLPEKQKAWMRAEIETSKKINLFKYLAEEKGRDFALNWFRDGDGYALAARSWVPFEPLQRAFILYLCWEEANLRGSRVTLHRLDDCLGDAQSEALVKIDPIDFQLYQRTGHLKLQISPENFRMLFETVWTDRAQHAGWALEFDHDGETCWMKFSR
jgi:hypothetical protein